MNNNKKLIVFFAVVCLFSSFVFYKIGRNSVNPNSDGLISSLDNGKKDTENDENNYGKFQNFIKLIEENYYFDIDRKKMDLEIKKAIFASLGDPYSQYLTEEDMNNLKRANTGRFVGVGIQVTITENGEVSIIAPIKGGPSERAGILPEDVVIKIDDKDVPKNDLEATVKLMRGNEQIGSDVKLTIKRMVNGEEKILDFNIKREQIQTETVFHEILDNNILYVSITNFGEKTGQDFVKAVDDGISKGVKAIVVDVRNNPGGLLTSVITIADKLLPEDAVIMKTVDSKKRENLTKSKEKGIDLPVVVLINKGSASASEVLAVALKDNNRAKLVGEKSFGKGIIQNIIPQLSGEGLKLTISEYFGPNDTKINKVGLEPDEKLEQNPGKIGIKHIKEDVQLQKAMEILKKLVK